jgi:hypothetical protein
METILTALPPLLATTGFVVYQVLRSRSAGNQVTLRVLEKIRSDPDAATDPRFEKLSKRDLLAAIQADQRLTQVVGRRDADLLGRALTHQFATDVSVYGALIAFAVAGMVLFSLGAGAPPKEDPAPARTMTPAAFEAGIEGHYQRDHGRYFAGYVSRPETARALLTRFLREADKANPLQLAQGLTHELFGGFCPASATAVVPGFAGYRGPGGFKDLNSWAKYLEDLERFSFDSAS